MDMKVFVIAMDKEAACVVSNLVDAREERLFGRRIVRGLLNDEEALVVVSGIGKTNAAAATQLALQLTNATTICNLGVSGGFDPQMNAGEIYDVADAVQYDFDLSHLNGTTVGTLDERTSPFIPCAPSGRFKSARLGTGDRFSDDEGEARLMAQLGIGLRDMEGAAIAHVCETAGVQCVSFKCVTNVIGKSLMSEQYAKNLPRCLAALTEFVKTY